MSIGVLLYFHLVLCIYKIVVTWERITELLLREGTRTELFLTELKLLELQVCYAPLSLSIVFKSSLGGRYSAQLIAKSRKGAICGDCGISLPGVSLL